MDAKPDTEQQNAKPRPGRLLIIGTGLFALLSMVIWSRNTFLETGRVSAVIGGAAAPLFWALAVALLFSISKRLRNTRSQTKVAMWTILVFVVAGMLRMSYCWNQAVVREINATCPKMLDEVTRMDGATAGPGKLVTIRETVLAMDGATTDMVAWRTTIAPRIRASSAQAPGIRKLLAAGTTVIYQYNGRDGVIIDKIKLTRTDLQPQ
ncbi:MAG: hypothetical protein PHR35_11480 [Kiritimatiellae bacterium]|nr:hypothetical protein [Kiritimatiellia bacterium]